jgi:hypothetical protein
MSPDSAIIVRAKLHPLSLLLRLSKVTITIDGEATTHGWGSRTYPVPSGPHEVNVSVMHFGQQMATAHTSVSVPSGRTVTVRYRSPATFAGMLASKAGTIECDQPE